MGQPDSRERIIAAATTLFAERGYGATTTRAIAEAAGLNIATMAYHVGAKADLYREVMLRAHRAQEQVVSEALGDLGQAGSDPVRARDALVRFADAYLDFSVETPHVPALWLRRWLSDGVADEEAEARYARPLAVTTTSVVRDVLDRAGIGGDVDVDLLVWTIVWTCHSFCRAGVLDDDGKRRGPEDPAVLARFRAHLQQVVAAVVGVPR